MYLVNSPAVSAHIDFQMCPNIKMHIKDLKKKSPQKHSKMSRFISSNTMVKKYCAPL